MLKGQSKLIDLFILLKNIFTHNIFQGRKNFELWNALGKAVGNAFIVTSNISMEMSPCLQFES